MKHQVAAGSGLLLLALTPLLAQRPAAPARPAPAPSYKDLKYPALGAIQIPNVASFTLPNGMKLYLLEDHELPVVNGSALVRTGNLFDPRDRIGLATLTGTVMRSGGTRSKTGEQLDEQLENIAAGVESSIGESTGSVSFSALKENTAEVLAIFKDVLTGPEFRQEKLDLAKSQMRSSISRRNDNAESVVEREFTDILYGKDTPYGWSEEYATIDRINRGDLQTFYQRYFFPANVMLGIRGDFDTAAMKSAIEKLFADWTVSQPPVPEFPKVAPAPNGGTYLAVKNDVTQTFFAIGQRGGQFNDKDYPALAIMADILGGGFQSRLLQRVRTQMGNAYHIGADWDARYDHPGLFEISGGTKSLSTVETIKEIREEVDRIRTAEVTEAELRTAKETALNSLVFAFDTKAKTLGRLLTYEYYGYPKDYLQQYQKALAAVTRADVLRVAREHLDPARFTVVTVGNPPDFGQPLDTLGSPVTMIDLTIPADKPAAPKADPAALERGKQLLQRVQQRVGGADRLAAVKDSREVSDFQLAPAAGGGLATETDSWILPSYFRQESVGAAGKFVLYWDGTHGWISTPQGHGALSGPTLRDVKNDLFRLYFRMLLSDRIEGRKVIALDDETIEIGDADGQNVKLVFDARTGLPVRAIYETPREQGPSVLTREDYADFREVAGIQVPYKVTIVQGGEKFADVTVKDLKVNLGLKTEELERRP